MKVIGGAVGGAVLSSSQAAGSSHNNGAGDDEFDDSFDPDADITVEEERLTVAIDETPVSQQILERSGFDRFEPELKEDLVETDSLEEAEQVVHEHGTRLWEVAVDRAQGRRPEMGNLDPYDDRPMYWARLAMTRALRQWQPDFEVTARMRKLWWNGAQRSVSLQLRGLEQTNGPDRQGGVPP